MSEIKMGGYRAQTGLAAADMSYCVVDLLTVYTVQATSTSSASSALFQHLPTTCWRHTVSYTYHKVHTKLIVAALAAANARCRGTSSRAGAHSAS
jgi:hypothetical protein